MNSEKKKVLVIDDQLEIRELVDVTLRGTEFIVLKASNGKEGIQLARERKPDLILLDIMMPVHDGYETCRVLKRGIETKDIPVIFLTAKRSKEDIKEALKAGGSDYIVKPFSPSEFLTRLRKIMESEELLRSSASEEKEGIKVDLKILIVNHSPTMSKILTNIVKKEGYSYMKVVKNGRDALALLMAANFNFLITEWDMPIMNGIDLTKAIRSDERLKNLYILMVTSRDKTRDSLHAINVGVNSYIATGLSPSTFKKKISEILRKFRNR